MHMPNAETMTPSMDPSVIVTPEQFAQAVAEKSADWMRYHNQLHQEIDQLQQGLKARDNELSIKQNELTTALVRAQVFQDLLERSFKS